MHRHAAVRCLIILNEVIFTAWTHYRLRKSSCRRQFAVCFRLTVLVLVHVRTVTLLHIFPPVLPSSMPSVLAGALASPAECRVHIEHTAFPLG